MKDGGFLLLLLLCSSLRLQPLPKPYAILFCLKGKKKITARRGRNLNGVDSLGVRVGVEHNAIALCEVAR